MDLAYNVQSKGVNKSKCIFKYPTFECALECTLAAVQPALASVEWPGTTLLQQHVFTSNTKKYWNKLEGVSKKCPLAILASREVE